MVYSTVQETHTLSKLWKCVKHMSRVEAKQLILYYRSDPSAKHAAFHLQRNKFNKQIYTIACYKQ